MSSRRLPAHVKWLKNLLGVTVVDGVVAPAFPASRVLEKLAGPSSDCEASYRVVSLTCAKLHLPPIAGTSDSYTVFLIHPLRQRRPEHEIPIRSPRPGFLIGDWFLSFSSKWSNRKAGPFVMSWLVEAHLAVLRCRTHYRDLSLEQIRNSPPTQQGRRDRSESLTAVPVCLRTL